MKTTVRIDGLKELEEALMDLSAATAKRQLRAAGMAALQPVADDYRDSVRRRTGDLAESAGVGTKLTRRQASIHRKTVRDDKASVEVFAGAGGLTQAITEEFGTIDQEPQGDLRASWDKNKSQTVSILKDELWASIEKARARAARKAARLAAKG